MIDIAEPHARFAQTISDRVRRKPGPVFDAGESLFLCGRHDLASTHKGGGGVAVEGVKAEDDQSISSPPLKWSPRRVTPGHVSKKNVPFSKGLCLGELLFEQSTGVSAQFRRTSRLAGQTDNRTCKLVALSQSYMKTAIVERDESRQLTFLRAHDGDRAASGRNAIELAGQNEPIEIGFQGQPVQVRSA
jgi:hypothetical protein